jgi:hypothetical protein
MVPDSIFKNIFYLFRQLCISIYLLVILSFLAFQVHAAPTCAGPIAISVSTDAKNPGTIAHLPNDRSWRYYVHVNSNGQPCSTAFQVKYCSEPIGSTTTCSNQSNWGTKVWDANRSDTNGIARIDFGKWNPNYANRNFRMQLKPYDPDNPNSHLQDPWSNEVSQYTDLPIDTSTISTSDYWMSKPGYVWEYLNSNYLTGTNGSVTRIQVEEETNVCENTSIGKVISTPWRITKNSPDAYWDPAPVRDGLANQRWQMVSPNNTYPPEPNFNNFYYMIGHKNYSFSPSDDPVNDYRNINLSGLFKATYNTTNPLRSPIVPGYNYLPKTLPANQTYLDTFENEQVTIKLGSPGDYNTTNCNMVTINPATNDPNKPISSWKTRVEKDYVTINNPGFQYAGEALRMDNYEGYNPLATSQHLLRESWYFVKNIGLVKIVVKHLNNYNNKGSPYCIYDNDCWADTIKNPVLTMTLNHYYQNPILKVELSTDKINWSESIVTDKSTGYYLRTTPAYNGFLEAKNFQGNIQKWMWVDNGIAFDSPDRLQSFQLNTPYSAYFRVWVPNETIPGETRYGDTDIPWSNKTTFVLSETIPTSSPTLTPSLSPKPGDTNNDRIIDGRDYVVWLNHYGQNLLGPINGDLNNDGVVDGRDYVVWLNNYGK